MTANTYLTKLYMFKIFAEIYFSLILFSISIKVFVLVWFLFVLSLDFVKITSLFCNIFLVK